MLLHRSIQRRLLRRPTLVGPSGPGRRGHGEKPEQPPGPGLRRAQSQERRALRTNVPATVRSRGPLLCEHLPPALSRAAVSRPAVAGGLDDTAGRSRQRSTSSSVKAEMLTGFGTVQRPRGLGPRRRQGEGRLLVVGLLRAVRIRRSPRRPRRDTGRAHCAEAPALRQRAEESEALLAPWPRTRAGSAKTRWPGRRTVG